VSITFVQNNFIKNLFITKSNERKSDTVSGHTSKPYIICTEQLEVAVAVEGQCQLGCSGLEFCSNFNHRPTELFRSCTKRADDSARSLLRLWESGTIPLPALLPYDIPVRGTRPRNNLNKLLCLNNRMLNNRILCRIISIKPKQYCVRAPYKNMILYYSISSSQLHK